MEIKVKRLDPGLELPRFAYEHDAALDLRSAHAEVLKPGEKKIIKTGLKMAIPKGYAGLIWDRSGLAAKHSIHTMAGVIDQEYTGDIGVILKSSNFKKIKIKRKS